MDLPLGVIAIILVALAFDFSNGFHDAANSIATVVCTRVLSPRLAVVWAAFFNFVAFLVFGVHVAKTIGKGVVDPAVVTPPIILAAVLGAIVWNLITWWLGLPTSSSHALIGGLAGAALVAAGPQAVIGRRAGQDRPVHRARAADRAGGRLPDHAGRDLGRSAAATPARRGRPVPRACSSSRPRPTAWATAATTRRRPWASSPPCCTRPGSSTASSTCRCGWCSSATRPSPLGTLFGGWRIVKTMGMKITKLQPVGGFCAETAGALTLFGATAGGHPGLHHPHHHRRDRRRRGQLHAAALGGQVGRGRAHRLGLGADHAGGGDHRDRGLVYLARAGLVRAGEDVTGVNESIVPGGR